MTEDYTQFIPSNSEIDFEHFSEDFDANDKPQPSETAMRNILQYAAGLFVFQDRDEQTQFLMMN